MGSYFLLRKYSFLGVFVGETIKLFCNSGIDWAATGSMLSGIGTILAGFAALYAIFYSYPNWKQREQFKDRVSDAKQVMSAFYEGREILYSIRAPFYSAGELSEAEKAIRNEDPIQTRPVQPKQSNRAALILRLQREPEYWQKLFRLSPIAKLAFGDEAQNALMELNSARMKISATLDLPFTDRTVRKTIYRGSSPNDDPIELLLDEAEKTLKKELSKYLDYKK